MRAQEFITEYESMHDMPTWLSITSKRIRDMVDNGEIPDNPDSIKAAAKQLAIDNYENIEGLDGGTIADEVEHQIINHKIVKNAHLGGVCGE